MTIFQIKASENKDGSPQTNSLELVYDQHPEYLKGIKKLLQLIIKEMKRKRITFLPNLRDDYEGEETFNRFIQNI